MADPSVVLIVGRCAVFAAALVLWGAAVFRLRLAPDEAPLHHEGGLRLLLLFGLVLTLPARVAQMGNGWADVMEPDVIWLVLTVTGAGQSWRIQMACAVMVLVTSCLQWRWATASLLAVVLLAQTLGGHAAASQGWFGVLRQGNDALHMMAAGAWIGALPFVWRLMQRTDTPETRQILIRYSRQGHIWVSLVLITGIVATVITVDSIPTPWGGPYQILLSLKITVTLGMVGLAVINRYQLVPRLSRDPSAREDIVANTASEIGLGLAAIALVAVLGMLDPT